MESKHPWFDESLSFEERIEALLGALTVKEKTTLLLNTAPAIPRLGIPAFDWWNEALHGVARAGKATIFPQAIGFGSSFDVPLIRQVGAAIGREGRAKHAAAKRLGTAGLDYFNLTYWTPNINIFRDPRWGRGQETYGEDPYLTGEIGKAMVQGMQGNDKKYLRSAACAKHFWAHSGPEALRHGFDAKITPFDAASTYLPAFKKLVREAKVAGVMGAYNRVNGEVCCGSENYIADMLRKQWGFKGYFTSDCGAICDFFINHHVSKDQKEAAALALKSGCDINCGHAYSELYNAYQKKLITKEDLDAALRRTLMIQMRLGMFDKAENVPEGDLPESVVGCRKHRDLTLKLAHESMVLLENKGVLPLSKDIARIALAGPNVEAFNALYGNYHGFSDRFSTPLEAILSRISVGASFTYISPTESHRPNVLRYEPEVVVYIGGFNEALEGEEGRTMGGDRKTLGLPENQRRELDTLYARDAKVVLVVIGGSPVDFTIDKEKAQAILFVPYPGERGGEALADILFGEVSPSGRLPITFPKSLDDVPPFEDYCMAGRTYRFLEKEPLYPFGYGKSYTSFKYSNLKWEVTRTGSLKLTYDVENTGCMDGEDVVQVYMRYGAGGYPVPNSELVAFKRIKLKRGEKKTDSISVLKAQLVRYGEDGFEQPLRDCPLEFFLGCDSSLNGGVSIGNVLI